MTNLFDLSGRSPLGWRKSSYSSSGGGNCVEVAAAGSGLAVRDSKDPDGPALGRFSTMDWLRFVGAVKSGRLGA